jgi:hypothetical protein
MSFIEIWNSMWEQAKLDGLLHDLAEKVRLLGIEEERLALSNKKANAAWNEYLVHRNRVYLENTRIVAKLSAMSDIHQADLRRARNRVSIMKIDVTHATEALDSYSPF